MLDKTNEYFLRGVAAAFIIKALAGWYLAANEEQYFVLIISVSLGLLFLQCTAAVYFHHLAMKVGALGFPPEQKWSSFFIGILSVHSATFFDKTDAVQSLNIFAQILVGLGFVAFMAFFPTYNAQKRKSAAITED